MTLSLGIDVGTSGVRTAVMQGDKLLSMARAQHPTQNPNNIDANGWWSAVKDCIQNQLADLQAKDIDPMQISGIAVDGTSGSMVLTDEDLNPVCPALMYNSKGFDLEAKEISKLVTGPHITKGANSALARALRLVSTAKSKPTYLLHQADFISAMLMGKGGHSDFNNSLKTGFDPEEEAWPGWIDGVIDPSLLPKVHQPGSPMGQVSSDIASRFGFSSNVWVHAGTTDSIAAFLASAPIKEGVAVTSLGSTLAIKLLSRQRIDNPEVGLYSHRLDDLWLVGGASNTGGAVLKAHFDPNELEALSKEIDPNVPTGLDFYPLLTPGERFPVNDPNFKPRMTPRPDEDAQFLQAMFEGMAAIEAQCYQAIVAKNGSAPKAIFTAGGGAQNTVWTEIRSKALGQMPKIAEHSEAAIGVAKLASSRSAT